MPTFRRRIPSIPARWSAVPPVLLVILVAGACAQADPASTAQPEAPAEAVYQRTPIRAAPAPSTTPAPTTTAPDRRRRARAATRPTVTWNVSDRQRSL